jgi:magnesium transporter
MIKTLLHDRKTGETRWGDEGLFAEWADNPDLWIWADFDNEALPHEKGLFLETFGLHPLVIADAQRERHPPKLEVFDKYCFLLLLGLDATTTDIDFHTIQIAFFVSDRFLVTRRKAESVSIDTAWTEAENGTIDVSRGPAHVAYRIVRRVTDRYTNLIEGLERRLDAMEDEMFENPCDALLEELIGYGRNLKRLRLIFNYHQDLFARLSRKGHPFIGKQERHEFIDAFEHTERLANLTNLYKELTDDLMNGYISVTSHRLNQIMKVLTVVTVIFMPLTVLAGIYGMNFEDMPELKFEHAYFFTLGLMGLIVIGLLLLFRKIRWL